MIWRLFAALRRIVRQFTVKNEFSAEWHRSIDRQSWQSTHEFPRWQAKEVGKRAYRVER